MTRSTEIKNGIIIFIGMVLYFLLMDVLGLSKYYYLRILNVFIILYGLNRTIKHNLSIGKTKYITNMISCVLTGLIGTVLSLLVLMITLSLKDNGAYLTHLSDAFKMANEVTEAEYIFGLLIQAVATVVVVSLIFMQYWKTKGVFKQEIKS